LTSSFHSGGVHPIILGAFGESNHVETRKLIKVCAKLIAYKFSNNDISPIDINGRGHGSPYNIIISQLRRAVGCLSLRLALKKNYREYNTMHSFVQQHKQQCKQLFKTKQGVQGVVMHQAGSINNKSNIQ